MKLKKIKLINWHIFRNNTIELNGNTLITGENASGKSTLMDAIYFVLSGGDSHHFNKAANESGQRNLETYLRGKLGSEKNPYLRKESDVMGYIALQFYDEKKQSVTLACGIEIESNKKPNVHFFVLYNYEIKDSDFIEDRIILDYRKFKALCKAKNYDFSDLPDTLKERRKAIGRDIFKLNDYSRFFDLLKNAISFKPITEVSTFVNSFLLEEDNIDLEAFKEEIRAYQEIHKMLRREKDKLNTLENEFIGKAERYASNEVQIKYLNALKIMCEIKNIERNINNNLIENQRMLDETKKLDDLIFNCQEDIYRIRHEIKDLENNEMIRSLNEKKNLLNQQNKQIDTYEYKLNNFVSCVMEEQKLVKILELNYRFDEDVRKQDFSLLKIHLNNFKEKLEELDSSYRNSIAKLNLHKDDLKRKIEDKSKEITNLKRGIENYPDGVNQLIKIAKEAIIKEFPKEKNPDVRPFCEHIEIKDKKWSNALEGYLNTQRFNLVFDPKFYDVVSSVYDTYKREHNLYGVGIVNCKFSNTKEEKNSMMKRIEVKNRFAKDYASYLLGKLVCVDTILELKNYDTSITPEVMIYKNHVLRACHPKIYEIPYIGKESREKRIKLLETTIKELLEEVKSLDIEISNYNNYLLKINKSNIRELISIDENYWDKILVLKTSNKLLEDEIAKDEKEEGIVGTLERLKNSREREYNITSEKREYEKSKDVAQQKIGSLIQRKKELDLKLVEEKEKYNHLSSLLNEKELNKKSEIFSNNGVLNKEKIVTELESAQKYNNAVVHILLKTMEKYSSNYKPALSPLIENLSDYINEYYELKNKGVTQFEYSAEEALERSKKTFYEDFISKLRSRIEKSKKRLDEINKNLSKHPFGTDEEIYKFYYDKSKDKEFEDYYRIITSNKELVSKDLFTDLLDEKESSIMKGLFDSIIQEIDSVEGEVRLQKYLDYRNYMTYDIRITNKHGDESYFSKINREKSGGETQTPFYIVIASCFDELMNKNLKQTSSTCVVVFDEAFNNMDEGRIEALMKFYKQLNIQVIIIVPSNRISSIVSYIDTLLGVVKKNNYPYIIDGGEKE